ncbi:hypothetical protein PsYK624_119840 [Phanerochaete sordida]|uniref:Uncharacterized protein n=1 Tax=Phanerochaete sordida TaxID=48140 RepID=A0A9P3GIW7_9APHY|nr:hypothetical protein PsYK624_119840 [Phanerochaete sordida]
MVRPSSGTSSQRQSRAVSYGLAFACNRALAGCMQSGSKTYHNTTRWTIRPRFTGYPPRVLLLQLEQVAVYKLLGLCPLHVVWNIERPSI